MEDDTRRRPDDERSAGSSRAGDTRAADPTEGVRIIGAQEAASAMERGDVAHRRGGNQPRFGDRPPPPPMGPRPALRFPLDASTDPTRIERPPIQPAPDPVTGPVELPHWTEPATGEVPQGLVGDQGPRVDDSEDDLDAWSSFASTSPRWRDADDNWNTDDTDFVAGLAPDDEPPLGALEDPDARPTHDEIFSFDDLQEQAEDRASGSSRLAVSSDDAEGEPPAEPPWASVPDADDFHDTGTAEATSVVEDATEAVPVGQDHPAEEAAHEDAELEDATHEDAPADAAPVPAGSFYDDEQDPPPDSGEQDEVGEVGGPPAEEPTGATAVGRAAKAKAKKAARTKDGDQPPKAAGRDVGTAVAVGVLLVAVFAGLLYAGAGWAMILVTLVIFLAAGEFFDALRKVGFEPATLLGIVACAAFPLAVYWRGLSAFPLLGALLMVGTLVWYLAGASGPSARVVEGTATTLFSVLWIGGLGSFAAAMLRAPDGRALLVITALATVAYDVGGFFVGRNAGHHHLSEASPNKTVEGLLGGMALCVVVTIIAVGSAKIGPYTGYGPALLVGVVAAIAAPLGDLCQSLVKRDLGIKDMSAILPGHGGVFDRFDAMLFVLPTIYYAVTIVGHRI